MPRPSQRSRSFRKVFKKTPGGTTKATYQKAKPKQAQCASCGTLLHGVPRERDYKMRTLAKTKKRPQRPFGGMLCSRCMRDRIKSQATHQEPLKA